MRTYLLLQHLPLSAKTPVARQLPACHLPCFNKDKFCDSRSVVPLTHKPQGNINCIMRLGPGSRAGHFTYL